MRWNGAQTLYWCFAVVPICFQLLSGGNINIRQQYTCTLWPHTARPTSLNRFQVLICVWNTAPEHFPHPQLSANPLAHSKLELEQQHEQILHLSLEISKCFFQPFAVSRAYDSLPKLLGHRGTVGKMNHLVYNLNLFPLECGQLERSFNLNNSQENRREKEEAEKRSLVISVCVNQ